MANYPITKRPAKKQYFYKVFGDTSSIWDTIIWDESVWDSTPDPALIAVWTDDVISEPTYRQTINGGDGELIVRLARPYDDYGENNDVSLNNGVEVYCTDVDLPSGQLVYRGYISGYIPTIDNEDEYVDVRVRGYGATLPNRLLQDASGNTEITYTDQDPSAIFLDIINKFRTNDVGLLNADATTIDNTLTSVSYTFNTNTYKEALDTLVGLSPVGWYWRIGADGWVYFKNKSVNAQHNFNVRKDVVTLSPEKNIEDFANEIVFIGGNTGSENLYLRKRDSNSIDVYGKVVKKVTDSRVTDTATATTIVTGLLENKATPARRTLLVVADNNGASRNLGYTTYDVNGNAVSKNYSDTSGTLEGYDIESVDVGDTIQVKQLTAAIPENTTWDSATWDTDVWDASFTSEPDDIMQIYSIVYSPDFLTIEATARQPEVTRRVEEVNKGLEGSIFTDNPTSPTDI